jgi:hypothetical protein
MRAHRRRSPRAAGVALVAALLVVPFAVAASDEAAAVERARELTAKLAGTLMPRLQEEIATHGTARALAVCAEVAQPLTVEAAGEGASLRRVSLRARNPADRPDEVERRVLEELQAAHAAGELPAEYHLTLDGPEGRELRYFKPIVVQPLCLRCHGEPENLEPEVRARLSELYPDDQAVGYREGDLRGAVSVSIPLPPAADGS